MGWKFEKSGDARSEIASRAQSHGLQKQPRWTNRRGGESLSWTNRRGREIPGSACLRRQARNDDTAVARIDEITVARIEEMIAARAEGRPMPRIVTDGDEGKRG